MRLKRTVIERDGVVNCDIPQALAPNLKWRTNQIHHNRYGHYTLEVKLCSLTVLEKKKSGKTELNVLWHSTVFPSGLSNCFFVSSVCLLVRATTVDKFKAVVCRLLATSAIMLPEKMKRKRKMWGNRRNISCDVHLLNEWLETDVPWDDAIVVSAGKLKKLWYSLSELHSS